MTTEAVPSRHEYLFDGRRVQVRDLIKAGLLQVDTDLVFRQPRRSAEWNARVRNDGWIELADGRAFASPSKAASVAAGAVAYDGWRAWQLVADDRFLADLRDQLIASDSNEEDIGSGHDAESLEAERRHRWLREAQIRSRSTDPMSLTVRELVGLWGSDSRIASASERIEADLGNRGLVTHPNFRHVTAETLVAVTARPVLAADVVGPDAPSASDLPPDDVAELELPQLVRGLAVGTLQSATNGIVSVKSTDSLDTAITKMLLWDYSQLAVIDGRTLKGAVSWKSIARARNATSRATLASATTEAIDVGFDHALVRLLPQIQEHEFVFVRNERNELNGIVTAFDVVAAYGELATPFLLVGEVDRALRHAIQTRFDWSDVQGFLDANGQRGLRSVNQLTIGDYQRFLENDANWRGLQWALDRVTFIDRLDEVRRLRNELMHFNPDPIDVSQVEALRHFAQILHEYC